MVYRLCHYAFLPWLTKRGNKAIGTLPRQRPDFSIMQQLQIWQYIFYKYAN